MSIPIRIIEGCSEPAIHRNVDADTTSRLVYIETVIRNSSHVQESLYLHQTNKLFWYIDQSLYRSFTFEKETIHHAVFSYFPCESHKRTTTATTISTERALVIFTSEDLRIYIETGEIFISSIPFKVSQVFPLIHGGMLLERKHDLTERSSMSQVHFPSLFHLSSILDEPSPVFVETDCSHKPLSEPFTSQHGVIQYVSKEYVVSWNQSNSTIFVYKFNPQKDELSGSDMDIDGLDNNVPINPYDFARKGLSPSSRMSPLFLSMGKSRKASIQLNHLATHSIESKNDIKVVLTQDWKDRLVLFVLDKLCQSMFAFSMNLNSKLKTFTPLFKKQVADMIPVSALQRPHKDLILLDESGTIKIWVGDPSGSFLDCQIMNEVGLHLDDSIGSKRPATAITDDNLDHRSPQVGGMAGDSSKTRIKKFLWNCDEYIGIEFHYSGTFKATLDLKPHSELVNFVLQQLELILDSSLFYQLLISFCHFSFARTSQHLIADEWHILEEELLRLLAVTSSNPNHARLGRPYQKDAFIWLKELTPLEHQIDSDISSERTFVDTANIDYTMLVSVVERLQYLFEEYLLRNESSEGLFKLGRFVANLSVVANMPLYTDYFQKRCIQSSHGLKLDTHGVRAPILKRPFSLYNWITHCISQMEAPTPSNRPSIPTCFSRLSGVCHLIQDFCEAGNIDQIVSAIRQCNLKHDDLSRFPLSLRTILWQILYSCREFIGSDHTSSFAIEALNRTDVLLQAASLVQRGDQPVEEFVAQDESHYDLVANSKHSILSSKTQAKSLMQLLKFRFRNESIIDDVIDHLRYSTETVLQVPQLQDGLSEEQISSEQQKVLQMFAHRVFSQTFGRGLFLAETSTILPTEKIIIPDMIVKSKLPPFNSSVTLQPRPGQSFEWADFHAGVAEALKIRSDAIDIDSSWIVFNQATSSDGTISIDAKHAGFVLGLGLTGHLRKIEFADSLRYYLLPQNELLSIGLLLGLSVSYYGSKDAAITQMLAVHIPSMLPPDASELISSGGIKSAAILGYGLVHAGSRSRYQIETLLNELKSIGPTLIQSVNVSKESYALSCGFALGFVALGDNSIYKEWSSKDDSLAIELLSLTKGKRASIVGSAATVALGLAYMMTNDTSVASKIFMPTNPYLLDFIQPDQLSLNLICKSLIMWDSVKPTMAWFDSNIPEFIRSAESMDESFHQNGIFAQAYYASLSGLSMVLGLKFSGTGFEDARALLLKLFDGLVKSAFIIPETYSETLVKNAKKNCLCMIGLSLSMIMAGTGDEQLFNRIKRIIHLGQMSEWHFGHQSMLHMALGLLFLGGGMMTLGHSKKAVAASFCAFYPKWSPDLVDQIGYLQAYRHLWILAVEKRGLVTYDADNKSLVSVSITVNLKDETKREFLTPCLLPQPRQIQTITITSPRYNFASYKPEQTLKAGVQGYFIWVKRKMGHLAHHEDPSGQRSIDTISVPHSKDVNRHNRAMESFVKSLSSDPQILALVKYLCQRGKQSDSFEMTDYCSDVLYNCLSHDKSFMVAIYLSLYRIRLLIQAENVTASHIQDIKLIGAFFDFVRQRKQITELKSELVCILEPDIIEDLVLLLDKMFRAVFTSIKPILRNYLVEQEDNSNLVTNSRLQNLAFAYMAFKSWPTRQTLAAIINHVSQKKEAYASMFPDINLVRHLLVLDLSHLHTDLTCDTIGSILDVLVD